MATGLHVHYLFFMTPKYARSGQLGHNADHEEPAGPRSATAIMPDKGRVERANRTLQDRLVKELRIAGISNIDDSNAFLTDFVERYNARFAKAPAKPDNQHRALNIEPDRLAEVFCLRDKRYVTRDLTLKYDRKRIRLEVNDLSRGLVGKYVDTYEFADGRIQVRAKGVALPCSIFDPHQ